MEHELIGRQNGAAIRAIRKKDRRRVEDVAEQIGLHPQALRNIENNSRPASQAVIYALADFYDIPVRAITRDGTDPGPGWDENTGHAAAPEATAA